MILSSIKRKLPFSDKRYALHEFFLTLLSIYLDHTYIHGVQHVPIKNLYLHSYVYITHIYIPLYLLGKLWLVVLCRAGHGFSILAGTILQLIKLKCMSILKCTRIKSYLYTLSNSLKGHMYRITDFGRFYRCLINIHEYA